MLVLVEARAEAKAPDTLPSRAGAQREASASVPERAAAWPQGRAEPLVAQQASGHLVGQARAPFEVCRCHERNEPHHREAADWHYQVRELIPDQQAEGSPRAEHASDERPEDEQREPLAVGAVEY
jgi:hypothetical protein|eukprot:7381274-Prymnesium_polylepis.2